MAVEILLYRRVQLINVTDDEAIVIIGIPADTTIVCGESIPGIPDVTATANCDDDLTSEFTEVQNGEDCPYSITRTWTVTDDCDNVAVETQSFLC